MSRPFIEPISLKGKIMKNYEVIREHWGDKPYRVGDIRKAMPADVAHLVGRCLVLVEDEAPKKKAAKTLKNKAVG